MDNAAGAMVPELQTDALWSRLKTYALWWMTYGFNQEVYLQLRSMSIAEQLRIVEKEVDVCQVTPQLVKLEIQLTTEVFC